MKYQYTVNGNNYTLPEEEVEGFLETFPDAKKTELGKTNPSPEKKDALVEEKSMASDLEIGSLEPQENDSILYENYQKATDVTEEEIKERFVDDYFELTKLNRELIEEGVEGAPFGVKRKLTERERRNKIPLDRIEDYDKYIETGEISISGLDRFETIKKVKEDKADDYYLNLSDEDRQRTSDLLTDKNLKIDNLKETLTTKSDQLDKIINQSNEELKPIETQMEEIGKKLERINDIYSGFVQPTDEKVSEFNTLLLLRLLYCEVLNPRIQPNVFKKLLLSFSSKNIIFIGLLTLIIVNLDVYKLLNILFVSIFSEFDIEKDISILVLFLKISNWFIISAFKLILASWIFNVILCLSLGVSI